MSYKIPAQKGREYLEQSLFSAKRAAKWSLRVAITCALVATLGLIGILFIPDLQSLFGEIASTLVEIGMIGSVLSLLVYAGNSHSSTQMEFQIQEYDNRKKAEELANSIRNLDVDDSTSPIDEWIQNRIRPEPQPFGVSDEGAEHLTAQWLQYLGFEEATVTQYSGDGGIDVETLDYVCQVKNYRDKAVSVTEVRELFGVAASERKRAILFTSSGATTQAIEFADKNGIALIRFDAKAARLEEINDDGSDLLVNGEYEDL